MAVSLKNLAADPDVSVKKADLYRVGLDVLVEDEGFNLRNPDDPDVVAHIESLSIAYASGQYVPPLIVRARDDGKVAVVDGHCRRRAALKAVAERGAVIEYLDCVAFKGSDVERVEVMLRAADGLKLTPLEQALGYLRLRRMGLTNADIGARVNRTGARIEQLMILATANADVHALVRSGSVTADAAIEAVREHGELAGQVLQGKVTEAKDAGKGKVTRGVLRGPSIPPKIVTNVVGSVAGVLKSLDAKTRRTLAGFETVDPKELRGKKVEVDAAALLALVRAQSEVDEARRKADEKAARQKMKAAQGDLPIGD